VEAIWAQGFTVTDLDAVLGEEATGGYLSGVLGDQVRLGRALTEALPLLGQQLAGPLAARLAEVGATGVVLVPCGHLGLLPLHAASYQRDDTARCLLEEVDVSYTPSARVLTTARHALGTKNDGAPVVAGVGNPLPHSQPLKFARAELEEVVACFQHARPLYEQAATKEALVEAAGGASYVHLSCHGLYDPAQPLSSQLQLAGQQSLTLGEILAERPFADARLVVASACQTAITDFNRLPDEAIGLPAGFLSAGTPGVVGTLWPVNDDLSTVLLMAQFYQYHLHGDPTTGHGPIAPVPALRRAQRWLATISAGELYDRLAADTGLQAAAPSEAAVARLPVEVAVMGRARFERADRDKRPFAHPYHWAPFVFVGA
jgi:CHAT domain-containing protein